MYYFILYTNIHIQYTYTYFIHTSLVAFLPAYLLKNKSYAASMTLAPPMSSWR